MLKWFQIEAKIFLTKESYNEYVECVKKVFNKELESLQRFLELSSSGRRI